MATATSIKPKVGEHRFLIDHIDWDGYETLLELFGDHGPRMNYAGGRVELMSPQVPHERSCTLIRYMVEALSDELRIKRNSLRSTTFKSRLAERGLEPDECYYFANAGKIGNQRSVDLDVAPPPDLAIEVEITSSLLDKLDIYAKIGVPELWRYDGEVLTAHLLQPDGKYLAMETSLAFLYLPMAEINRFLDAYEPDNEMEWGLAFRQWVRDVVLPLARNQG